MLLWWCLSWLWGGVSGVIASDTSNIADSASEVNIYFADSAIIFPASKIGHEQEISANHSREGVGDEAELYGAGFMAGYWR